MYAILFFLAIAVALLIAWRQGRRDGHPSIAWATVLAAGLTGAMIGMKLIFFDLEPIEPGEMTNLGGIALGTVAVLAAARMMAMEPLRVLDSLTPATLAGMAIGRVGCFLAGCCTGTETSLPWGVSYAGRHPVHPVQLYEALADTILLAVVVRRVGAARAGARFTTAVVAYALVRVAMEFMRAGRTEYAGLNPVQWILLASVCAVPFMIRWRRPMLRYSPSLAAVLMWQQPQPADSARTEIVVGGGFIRGDYVHVEGREEPDFSCDSDALGAPTFAHRRVNNGRLSLGLRRRVGPDTRITAEGLAVAGTDRLRRLDSGPIGSSAPRSANIAAGGLTGTVERPNLSLSMTVLAGRLSRGGDPHSGVMMSGTALVGADRGWFVEGHLSEGEFFSMLGDASRIGVGYRLGAAGPRLSFGAGGGVAIGLHLPLREEFEADVRFRSYGVDDADGQIVTIGMRRAFRMP